MLQNRVGWALYGVGAGTCLVVNLATNNDAYVRAAVPWQTGRGQETARHTTRRDRTGQSAERGRCTVVVRLVAPGSSISHMAGFCILNAVM